MNWDAVVRLLAMRFHFTAWTRLEPNTALYVTYINSTANRLPTLQLVYLGSMNPAKMLNGNKLEGA